MAEQQIQPPVKSIRVKKFRVDFSVPNPDPKTADDVPWKSLGMVKMVLQADDWANVVGIAFRRCNPEYLKATRTQVFEL